MNLVTLNEFDLDIVPTGVMTGMFHLNGVEGYRLPFHIERASCPGPVVLLTAGIHAAEYTCIEAAQDMMSGPVPLRRGTLVVLPVVNWKGYWERSIFINPADGKNLNRVFPGRVDGTESERIAYWITQKFVSRSNAHIDLHSGDLIERLQPFCIYHRDNPDSRALSAAFGMPYMAASTKEGYTVTSASTFGCAGVIAEAGDFGNVGVAETAHLVLGVRRVLAYLDMADLSNCETTIQPSCDLETEALLAEADCLWYPTVIPGQVVKAGDPVGQVRSGFGVPPFEVVSPRDGIVLYMMNGVPVRKGEPLLSLGYETHTH